MRGQVFVAGSGVTNASTGSYVSTVYIAALGFLSAAVLVVVAVLGLLVCVASLSS